MAKSALARSIIIESKYLIIKPFNVGGRGPLASLTLHKIRARGRSPPRQPKGVIQKNVAADVRRRISAQIDFRLLTSAATAPYSCFRFKMVLLPCRFMLRP